MFVFENSRQLNLCATWHRWLASGIACLLTLAAASASAQSSSASLTGTVVDVTGAALRGVEVILARDETSVKRTTITKSDGAFVFAAVKPGRYTLRASTAGFATAEVRGVVLNVDDRVEMRVEMKLASMTEQVVVETAANRINTSPAVGTVIDRQFVENLPLNGRSLQSLLELTPGVIITPVALGIGSLEGGQFSVNGQRTNSNYLTIDGVSGNVGGTSSVGVVPGQGGSGQLPAFNAVGGTQGLVTVDALQEFRIQTSSYAPEFGRTPGGQISMVTRSGTNVLHGSAYEYFRHDKLDARDWFVNYRGQDKARLRQNQFGGVLGGPIWRDRTHFFGSYEGLRLEQPRARDLSVPSLETRRSAAPGVRPFVEAFPLPNGPNTGTGLALLTASWSDPSRYDSTAVRIDHRAGSMTFFGRVSHAPSYSKMRSGTLSWFSTTHQDNDSVTVGQTWIPKSWLVHDLRVNYTTNKSPFTFDPDDFGGAVPAPASIFTAGTGPDTAWTAFTIIGASGWRWGVTSDYNQRQINVIDSVTLSTARHHAKVGIDYRRFFPIYGSFAESTAVGTNVAGLLTGLPQSYLLTFRGVDLDGVIFDNVSLYAQDAWKASSALTVTFGVRWEWVPPPHAASGEGAVTLENMDDPYGGRVSLAPRGTPLWKTRYNNFAPRLGATYMLSDRPGAETVVRAGGGVFYDLGYGQVASGFTSWPFVATKSGTPTAFPLPPQVVARPDLGGDTPNNLVLLDRDLILPRTYQWNVSIDRSFGAHHSLTASYVGAEGRELLKMDRYGIRLVGYSPISNISVSRNEGYSDYRSLQLQFQRRQHRGIQYLASYTLGRSRDTISTDATSDIPAERLPPALDFGYSDFDVRHVLTAALTYQMPDLTGSSFWHMAGRGWGMDLMGRFRSALPIAIKTNVAFPPESFSARPNVVPGQPFWIDDPSVPAGRRLNRYAFSLPPVNTQGDLVRGSVRGFSVHQIDLALRRDFRLFEGARLQFRFELFNVLNTPQFMDPIGLLEVGQFGVVSQSLNSGYGGLSSLYQVGGARSTQLAVKLLF